MQAQVEVTTRSHPRQLPGELPTQTQPWPLPLPTLAHSSSLVAAAPHDLRQAAARSPLLLPPSRRALCCLAASRPLPTSAPQGRREAQPHRRHPALPASPRPACFPVGTLVQVPETLQSSAMQEALHTTALPIQQPFPPGGTVPPPLPPPAVVGRPHSLGFHCPRWLPQPAVAPPPPQGKACRPPPGPMGLSSAAYAGAIPPGSCSGRRPE